MTDTAVRAPAASAPAAPGPAASPELAGAAAQPAEEQFPGMPEPRLRLSFSRVDTYRSCPLRFRFAYVDKLPTRPSPHLSWGTSIHNAIEAWWDSKLPEAPPLEVLLRALYDGWDDSGFAGMPREEKLKWYGHAREVLHRHHARYADRYVPAVASEAWFELDLGEDIQVVGSIDHVARTAGGGIGIVDWKTSRKAKDRRRVAGSLQLAIYAMAARELWGQEPEWVALDFVVPGVRVTVDRKDIDTDAAVDTIREVADRIRSEVFEPTPTPLCGWCDFRGACPAFDGDGPDVPGLAVVELQRLRRRRAADERRIAELEALIRERLGEDACVDVGG